MPESPSRPSSLGQSVWQSIGIYAVGCWGVLQVVDVVTDAAGLPDWTPGLALLLMVLGLPICVATAIAQRRAALGGSSAGDESEEPAGGKRRELLTWRNAAVGGAGAFGVLVLSVGVYLASWAAGIGPVGSLVAKGAIIEGDEIVLADFKNSSSDASLGNVVTETIRVDLNEARTVSLVSPAVVDNVLRRMGHEAIGSLTPEIAREVAQREGIKAVLEGEVASAGSGYLLLATLRAAESGEPLASLRRTAAGPDEIIPAIDGLSQDLRERAGESLRSIKADEPLEAVTTSSIDALRKYTAALQAETGGEHRRAKRLLEEAVEIDPEFAMAWRWLAVTMQDAGGTQAEQAAAATKAYELRHRLTERERHIAAAYYHNTVTGDLEPQFEAYRAVLDQHPDDSAALNNLAILHSQRRQWEHSIALYEQAIGGRGTSNSAWSNLVFSSAALGDLDKARATQAQIPLRDVWYYANDGYIALAAGEWAAAQAAGEALITHPEAPPGWRDFGHQFVALADVGRGEIGAFRARLAAVIDTAAAEGRAESAVLGALGVALIERLIDPESGRGEAQLRALIEPDGVFWEIPGESRNYRRLALELAASGMVEETRGIMASWTREGGASASGSAFEAAAATVDALLLGVTDPAAGADALRRLRTQLDCARCFGWKLGDFLERAGRLDEARAERERSAAAAEFAIFFGLYRLRANAWLAEHPALDG